MGGNGQGLDQMASLVPNTVFKTLATLKASGIDIGELAKKAGIDISALARMAGPTPGGNQPVAPVRPMPAKIDNE